MQKGLKTTLAISRHHDQLHGSGLTSGSTTWFWLYVYENCLNSDFWKRSKAVCPWKGNAQSCESKARSAVATTGNWRIQKHGMSEESYREWAKQPKRELATTTTSATGQVAKSFRVFFSLPHLAPLDVELQHLLFSLLGFSLTLFPCFLFSYFSLSEL